MRAVLGGAVFLLAAAAALCCCGCMKSFSYANVCGPNDLRPAQVQELASRAERYGGDRMSVTVGERLVWFPFLYAHAGENRLLQAGSWSEAMPGGGPAPRDGRTIQATEFHAAGPLMLLWYDSRDAHYDLAGKNYYYARTTAFVWGFLWQDHVEGAPEDRAHRTGPLWTGFGYGSRGNLKASARYLRFFWLPIPVWHAER